MRDSKEIRKKFLTGKLSDRERQDYLEWLADPVNRKNASGFLQEIWDRAENDTQIHYPELEPIKDAVLRTGPAQGRNLRTFKNFLSRAAIWMVPVMLGLAIYFMFRPEKGVEMLTLSVEHGQVESHVLPDSSRLWINAGSRISYPENMDKGLRQLSLEGEAYFQVKPSPDQPFRVSAGELIIEVTGTAFNASCYENEDHISVTLSTGEVMITAEKEGEQILLAPGKQARYNKLSNEFPVLNVDPEAFSSWINGQITFRNMPLKDVLLKLERKYGVSFILEDPELKQRPITGTIRDENLEEVLRLIQLTSPVEYKRKENEIILCPKRD